MISTCQRQPLTDIHTRGPACLLLKSEAPRGRRCLGRRREPIASEGGGKGSEVFPAVGVRAGMELSTKNQGPGFQLLFTLCSCSIPVHLLPRRHSRLCQADISEAMQGSGAGRKGTPTPVLQGGELCPTGSVNPSPPDPAKQSGVHGLGRGPESIHSIQEVRRVSLSQLGKDTPPSNE